MHKGGAKNIMAADTFRSMVRLHFAERRMPRRRAIGGQTGLGTRRRLTFTLTANGSATTMAAKTLTFTWITRGRTDGSLSASAATIATAWRAEPRGASGLAVFTSASPSSTTHTAKIGTGIGTRSSSMTIPITTAG